MTMRSVASPPVITTEPMLIARQAIVDARKSAVAYELFNRSRTTEAHTAASDVLLLFTALSHTGPQDFVGSKLLFVNCTHESLAGGHLDLLNPEKIVLEIQLLGHAAAAEVKLRTPMLQSLRQRGFRLSFDHGVLDAVYADWLALADFIKLDLTTLTQEQWPALVQYTKTYSKAHLIATKVETAEQFETLSRLGVLLFQGYYFARPTVFEASLFIPHQASLVHLVGLLRSQASNDTLEETLKKDLGLAFNLLRLINSASFGLAHKVGSIKQAVALMGLKRLFRWAALLMAATKAAPAPTYEPNSLVRARQMELLAEDFLSPAQTEMAFVVGMFSTLQELIDTPFEEICELLHLPTPLRTALMQEGETLGTLLQVAKACEQSDEALFDSATEQLQLTDSQVNWAHLRALAWSDPITVG